MKKPQVGEIIKADGTRVRVLPAKGGKFSLEELQAAVGGYIQRIALAPGNGRAVMYADEDGKAKRYPLNPAASRLMSPHHSPGDVIVGDVIVVRTEQVQS